jgi:hypothetical protein
MSYVGDALGRPGLCLSSTSFLPLSAFSFLTSRVLRAPTGKECPSVRGASRTKIESSCILRSRSRSSRPDCTPTLHTLLSRGCMVTEDKYVLASWWTPLLDVGNSCETWWSLISLKWLLLYSTTDYVAKYHKDIKRKIKLRSRPL